MTNISTTVRFYNEVHGTSAETAVFFFIKRAVDIRFTVTITTDTVRNTESQVIHSDDIMACYYYYYFFSLHIFNSLFPSVARLPLKRILKEFN